MLLRIRRFLTTDVSTIAEFQKKLAFETEGVNLDHDQLLRGITAMIEDNSKGAYFVAENDKQIVGCFMVTHEWSDWRNGSVYWLQSLYVPESYRGKGVFRSMFNHLKTIVNNDPAAVGIRLYVDKTNTKAQQIYRTIGMNGDHYTMFEWMK